MCVWSASGTWLATCFSPPGGSVLQLQLAFVPDTVPLSVSPSPLSVSPSLSILVAPWGIEARLSKPMWHVSWAPNGAVRVKQGLFSHALIGSKIMSLSTARLRSPIILPLMLWAGHVLMWAWRALISVCCTSCFRSVSHCILCVLYITGTRSRCSLGSQGSTQWPPCSQLLLSQQPSAPRRSSAGRCCLGPCQSCRRYPKGAPLCFFPFLLCAIKGFFIM